MLGTRAPQRGLFEADTLYANFVGRDTFYGWLAGQRGELFPDELFLGFSIAGWGRPSVPPSLPSIGLVNKVHTYCGLDTAIMQTRPARSCIHRFETFVLAASSAETSCPGYRISTWWSCSVLAGGRQGARRHELGIAGCARAASLGWSMQCSTTR